MKEALRLYCDSLGKFVVIPRYPRRIVSLVSSLTETLYEMGAGDRVVGVSSYCGRYVAGLTAPIVGDYLRVDENLLQQIEPDLVLTTTGVQRSLGRHLSTIGFPVFSFPLPGSLYGILENVIMLGCLLDQIGSCPSICSSLAALLSGAGGRRAFAQAKSLC